MEEIWKDIEGYERLYQISDRGRVRSLRKNIILRPGKFPNGYLFASLKVKGKQCSKMIHRLVAEAFLSNPGRKKEVNHKDGDKQNNVIENLEWVTRQENIKHAFLHELIRVPGDKSRNDWNGYVNIYNQNNELVGQAASFIDAAEWVWKNTEHKISVASAIGKAYKENKTAYGLKFERIKRI
jgi:hypothetical protein